MPIKGSKTDFGKKFAVGEAVEAPERPAVPSPAKLVTDLIDQIGAAVKNLGAEVAKAVNPLGQIGQAMASFVGMVSPADLQLFNRAMADFAASIGQLLLPIFRLVTESVRQAADTMHSLAPLGETLAAAFKPLFDLVLMFQQVVSESLHILAEAFEKAAPALAAMGAAVVEMMRAWLPVLELLPNLMGALADVMVFLAPHIVALTRVFADFITWVISGVKELLALMGVELAGGPARAAKKGESVGTAIASVGIGSVEDMGKKAMISAFSLGKGADPAKETAAATKDIAEKANAIKLAIDALPAAIQAYVMTLPQKVWELFMESIIAVKNFLDPSKVAEKVNDFVKKEFPETTAAVQPFRQSKDPKEAALDLMGLGGIVPR